MGTITLYGQPKGKGPMLDWGKMKSGIFEQLSTTKATGTAFTDVLGAIWDIIRIQDSNAIMTVVKPNTVSDTTFILSASTGSNKFTFRRDLYKGSVFAGGAENIDNYFVTITFDGNENVFTDIIQKTVKHLGFIPNNISDWSKFTKKAGIGQSDVIEKWRHYTESKPVQQQSTPSSQAQCPKCNKAVSPDFAICPFCGQNLKEKSECKKCGKELQPEFAMCPFCGASRN